MADRSWSDPSNTRRDPTDNDGALGVSDPEGAPGNFLWTFPGLIAYLTAKLFLRADASAQVNGDVGYTGINQALAPGATEIPTPSAGHYRNLVGGSGTVTPPAMTETSWVSWTFDVTVYTIDTSNYQVLGTVPSAGTHTLVFDNFGTGPQTATWFNQS